MKSATFATWMALAASIPAQLPFTYETTSVLSSSGDFGTADGIMDVVVVDRVTGNAIVGKQSAGGAMTFTAPEPCGITNVTGLAVDRFIGAEFGDVFAVTEPSANRITQGYLEIGGAPQFVFRHNYTTNPSPRSIAPFNVNGDGLVDLMVVGQQSLSPVAHFYEMITNLSGGSILLWQAAYAPEISRIYRFVQKTGTAPILAENFGTTFYVDALTATGFGPARGLSDSPVDSTSLMTYGNFDGSAYAQVILCKSGDVTARAAKVTEPVPGSFSWAASTNLVFPKQIRQLFTIHIAGGGARLGVLFRDNTAAVYSFNGTTLALRNTLDGAPFDWLNPLGNDVIVGRNPTGWRRFDTTSAAANLLPTHSGALAESSTTRRVSNVIFFNGEPFANATATPVQQSSVREWSTAVAGSSSSWSVSAANITPAGIGAPVSSPYFTSSSATHGLPNQYRANISTRSLEAGAGSLVLDVAILPPGGVFRPPEILAQAVPVTFTTTTSASLVKYRINSGAWLNYNPAAPPRVFANSTVQAYAISSGLKSPVRSATYTFADAPDLAIGASPDLDGDGIPDAWEKSFNLTNPAADADGDGVDNLGEYLSGTDPRDAGDTPEFEFVLRQERSGLAGSTLRLSWDLSLGNVILESNNTLSGIWQSIDDNIVTENSEHVRYFTLGTPNPPARFFRLRRP